MKRVLVEVCSHHSERSCWSSLVNTPGLFLRSLLGIAIVSLITQRLARLVPGIGIAIPLFIPPLIPAEEGEGEGTQ